MESESGQSGSRAMLFITSLWSAREKYKDPTVLSPFLILLHCFFTYKHHPGSSCIAGHDAENLIVLQLTKGYRSTSSALYPEDN